MKQAITTDNWQAIRQHFRRSFLTNVHTSIASVGADGQPVVTSIGSLGLRKESGRGFYFEMYTGSLPKNAQTNPRVCVMAVNSSKWFWLKALLSGRFSSTPMVKLYGELGERRQMNPPEIERFQRLMRFALKTPGGKKLWSHAEFVREIRFDTFETAKLGEMTQGLKF